MHVDLFAVPCTESRTNENSNESRRLNKNHGHLRKEIGRIGLQRKDGTLKSWANGRLRGFSSQLFRDTWDVRVALTLGAAQKLRHDSIGAA